MRRVVATAFGVGRLNTLLEGSGRMAYHTDLRLVFRAFGGRQREFNWLITDLKSSSINKIYIWSA